MYCPRCKTRGENFELQTAKLEGIEVDICKNCGGIWFDKEELGEATKVSPVEIQKLTTLLEENKNVDKIEDTELQCPKCNIPMFKYRYMYTSNIYIDSCERCEGIWIDKGELIQIINYLEEASKVDPEKEATILARVKQIKFEYEQREKEFIDSLVKLDDTAKNPISKALGTVLQSIYTFLYKKGL